MGFSVRADFVWLQWLVGWGDVGGLGVRYWAGFEFAREKRENDQDRDEAGDDVDVVREEADRCAELRDRVGRHANIVGVAEADGFVRRGGVAL